MALEETKWHDNDTLKIKYTTLFFEPYDREGRGGYGFGVRGSGAFRGRF